MHRSLLAIILAAATVVPAAHADEDLCNVPKAEWQPQEALQEKLEAEGWQVRRIKIDDGCYEVYGLDSAKSRMEAYFDPKTFKLVKSEKG